MANSYEDIQRFIRGIRRSMGGSNRPPSPVPPPPVLVGTYRVSPVRLERVQLIIVRKVLLPSPPTPAPRYMPVTCVTDVTPPRLHIHMWTYPPTPPERTVSLGSDLLRCARVGHMTVTFLNKKS